MAFFRAESALISWAFTASLIMYQNTVAEYVFCFFPLLKRAQFLSSAPSEPSGKRPPIVADSEVYKMLQENQESDEPPRQSASFKVLQEILETGTDTMLFPYTLRGNVGYLYCIFKQC